MIICTNCGHDLRLHLDEWARNSEKKPKKGYKISLSKCENFVPKKSEITNRAS